MTKKTKPAAKPVAKPKTKDTSKVDNDPLADLGLETSDAPTATQPAATVTETSTTVTEITSHTGRDEVEVGEIELGFAEFIPTAKRKAEGSKYKFDELVAPSTWTDGPNNGKQKIANFFVKLLDGVDADKLRRSVQSATTQANKQGKEAGKYFVSRSATKDGKFIGMIVYRTDKSE